MFDKYLRYQPVLKADSSIGIHEVVLDDEGTVVNVSYDSVRLEADSMGQLEQMMRHVYRDIRNQKPITEDELDMLLHQVESQPEYEDDYEDNERVIDCTEFFGGRRG